MHPDQQYIDALVNNDKKLLLELYQKCFPAVQKMVLLNQGTEACAADIFQDALIEVYKKAKNQQLTLTFSLCAYLKGICRNKWYDELKKRKLAGVTFTGFERLNNLGEDFFPLLEEHHLKQTRLDLVRKKFAELGESCKQLLQLSWTKNALGKKRSTEEIAQTLKGSSKNSL